MRTLAISIVTTILCMNVWASEDSLHVKLYERSYVKIIEHEPMPIPEPETLWLLAIAGGVAWVLKKRK